MLQSLVSWRKVDRMLGGLLFAPECFLLVFSIFCKSGHPLVWTWGKNENTMLEKSFRHVLRFELGSWKGLELSHVALEGQKVDHWSLTLNNSKQAKHSWEMTWDNKIAEASSRYPSKKNKDQCDDESILPVWCLALMNIAFFWMIHILILILQSHSFFWQFLLSLVQEAARAATKCDPAGTHPPAAGSCQWRSAEDGWRWPSGGRGAHSHGETTGRNPFPARKMRVPPKLLGRLSRRSDLKWVKGDETEMFENPNR